MALHARLAVVLPDLLPSLPLSSPLSPATNTIRLFGLVGAGRTRGFFTGSLPYSAPTAAAVRKRPANCAGTTACWVLWWTDATVRLLDYLPGTNAAGLLPCCRSVRGLMPASSPCLYMPRWTAPRGITRAAACAFAYAAACARRACVLPLLPYTNAAIFGAGQRKRLPAGLFLCVIWKALATAWGVATRYRYLDGHRRTSRFQLMHAALASPTAHWP